MGDAGGRGLSFGGVGLWGRAVTLLPGAGWRQIALLSAFRIALGGEWAEMVAVEGSVSAGVGGDASPATGMVSVGAVLLWLLPGLLLTSPHPGAELLANREHHLGHSEVLCSTGLSSSAQVMGEHPLPPSLPPGPTACICCCLLPQNQGCLPWVGGGCQLRPGGLQPVPCCGVRRGRGCSLPSPCQGAACSYMGKRGEPGKCDSRLQSCLFLHCLCLFSGASQLALEPPLPWLHTA